MSDEKFVKEPTDESVREGLKGFDPFRFMNERPESEKVAADRLVHDATVAARGETVTRVINVDEKTGHMTSTLVDKPGDYVHTLDHIREVVKAGPIRGSGGKYQDMCHDLLKIIDERDEEIRKLKAELQVTQENLADLRSSEG